MTGGRTYLLIGSCLIGSACTPNNQVHVHALSDRGASNQTGNALLAQARAQLAIGSVGLALENFRTLQVQQGDSVETFEGIAACYAAMGRYDLTRTNLEFALAYSPSDRSLLNEYSAALERLGERAQAAEVRAEAERLQVAAATKTETDKSTLIPLGVARVGSVTVKLPAPSRPAGPNDNRLSEAVSTQFANLAEMRAQSPNTTGVRASVPPATQSRVQATGPIPAAEPQSKATQEATIPIVEQVALRSALVSAPQSDLQFKKLNVGSAVVKRMTIEKATKKSVELAVAGSLSPPNLGDRLQSLGPQQLGVDATQPRTYSRPDVRRDDVPHLERISPGEVALLIGSSTRKWSNIKITEASARSNAASPVPLESFQSRLKSDKTRALASLRWVPLKSIAAENVQLLNAARRQGLAADVRTTLLDRGWRRIGIGNAAMVKARTVVLYGKSRTQIAYRLAAQFRCKAQKIAGLKTVIVLLGRDAIRRQASSRSA